MIFEKWESDLQEGLIDTWQARIGPSVTTHRFPN